MGAFPRRAVSWLADRCTGISCRHGFVSCRHRAVAYRQSCIFPYMAVSAGIPVAWIFRQSCLLWIESFFLDRAVYCRYSLIYIGRQIKMFLSRNLEHSNTAFRKTKLSFDFLTDTVFCFCEWVDKAVLSVASIWRFGRNSCLLLLFDMLIDRAVCCSYLTCW